MENSRNFEQNGEEEITFEGEMKKIEKAAVTPIKRLRPSNDLEAKAEFMANEELEHPRNIYGNLKPDEIVENIHSLRDVNDELNFLRSEAENDPDRQRFSDKEERLIRMVLDKEMLNNKFVLANYAYQIADTPEDKEKAREIHQNLNKELYGEVDQTTFYGLLKERIDSIHPETDEEKANFELLKEKIGFIPEDGIERFKPKQETVERFSEIVQTFFGGFLEHIPEDKEKLTSEEVVSTINEILDEELEGGYDYLAIVDKKASSASVNHDEKLIKFPGGKEYPINKAKALICHELGTHVMRAIPFLDHDLKVFSKGLPKNMDFDEGVAKCVEQAINGKYEDSGIDHYLNIGMATYLGKNFREVYDIQNLMKSLTHKSNEKVITAVQRCFRGTGELPNNKDLTYYNGANQVWKYIEDHIDDPELMDNLYLSGKASMNHDEQQLVYEAKTGGLSTFHGGVENEIMSLERDLDALNARLTDPDYADDTSLIEKTQNAIAKKEQQISRLKQQQGSSQSSWDSLA